MGPTPAPPTLTCLVCGTENPATRQFCRKCAADLRSPTPVPAGSVAAASSVPLRPIVLGGALALLVVLVLGGTIVLLGGGSAPPASPSASPNAPTLGTPSATTAAPTAAPTSTTVPAATPTPASVRPPRIRFFVGPDAIECADPSHSGFIHARWEVRNVTGVTISIDGPGIYREYVGLTGEDDLPFSCSQSHSYLLTTVGGNGPPATREIVVEPIEVPTSTSP